MPMSEGLLPEQITRAKALRKASVLIATHAEPGPTRADLLDRLALLIADVEGTAPRECRSCGAQFGVGRDELKFCRSRALAVPTQCRRCRTGRKQRRAERSVRPFGGERLGRENDDRRERQAQAGTPDDDAPTTG